MFGLDPYYSDEMSVNSNKVKVRPLPFRHLHNRISSSFCQRLKEVVVFCKREIP